MIKNKLKNQYFVIITFSILLVILIELIILLPRPDFKKSDENIATLIKYAEEIITKCDSETYHPTCYDREVPKLMDKISMEEAFKVTAIIQSKDSTYPYCHVLGHELSAREVGKDPSKWKDVLTRCPAGQCSNGCLHGGLQERFRGTVTYSEEQIEEVKKDLADICEKRGDWNPTGLEQASCYHAVGHLSMYLTSADLIKSGKICDYAAVKSDGRNYLDTCYDGNFMQIFQPLEDEDKDLIAGKEVRRDELETFCKKFGGEQRVSCWHEGWPLYSKEIVTPNGLIDYCTNPILATDADKDQCFLGLFYVITVQLRFDIPRITEFCSSLPGLRMDQCFANTASRLIETDYNNLSFVTDYCASAPTESSRTRCYNELIFYSTFNFHSGSKEFYSLCNSLPGEWKGRCLGGAKNTSG
ncbi:MAG: hypothetical protein WAX44_00035 [Minisyncoccia bacterium]